MIGREMKVTANAQRSGNQWEINVPEVPGFSTKVRRLDQIDEAVAEAVAPIIGIDPASVDVETIVHTAHNSLIANAKEEREAADAAAIVASQKMREAARAVLADGLTVRDTGYLLGVSPQRISQLVPYRGH